MKVSTIILTIIKVAIAIAIIFFVFWIENRTLNIHTILDKLQSPHEIRLYDDILIHWWPLFIVMSIYFNIFATNCIIWFYNGLNKGTIRWGGKSGND